jgi:hypothetical protein
LCLHAISSDFGEVEFHSAQRHSYIICLRFEPNFNKSYLNFEKLHLIRSPSDRRPSEFSPSRAVDPLWGADIIWHHQILGVLDKSKYFAKELRIAVHTLIFSTSASHRNESYAVSNLQQTYSSYELIDSGGSQRQLIA